VSRLSRDYPHYAVPDDEWPMLVIVDARTIAAQERHLLMVSLDPDASGQTARATTAAVVEIAVNLWLGNMDWYETTSAIPADLEDDVIEAWNIPSQ
jgi:hypothetical protein